MVVILFFDHQKTELQIVQYSNVFGVPLFGIQVATEYVKNLSSQ